VPGATVEGLMSSLPEAEARWGGRVCHARRELERRSPGLLFPSVPLNSLQCCPLDPDIHQQRSEEIGTLGIISPLFIVT